MTVPEVRHLLLTLIEPPECFAFRLAWLAFRRHHQAVAKACHIARRIRERPVHPGSPQVQVLQATTLELTDEQWARISPLLPPQKPAIGRPMLDHRQSVGGMLWAAGTGSSWRALPAEFGPWETVYSRYRRWRSAGIWDRMLEVLNSEQAPSAAALPPRPTSA